MTVQNGTIELCEACAQIFADGSLDTYSVQRDLEAPLPPHILDLQLVPGLYDVCDITGLFASGEQFRVRRTLDLYGYQYLHVNDPSSRWPDEELDLRIEGIVLIATRHCRGKIDERHRLKIVCTVPSLEENPADVRVYTVPLGVFMHHGDRVALDQAIADGCPLCQCVPPPEHGGVATWFQIGKDPEVEKPVEDYRLQLGNAYLMSTSQGSTCTHRSKWVFGRGSLYDFDLEPPFAPHRPRPSRPWLSCVDPAQVLIRPRAESQYNIQLGAQRARSTDNTGTPESLQLALAWLTECLSNHRKCAKVSEPAWMPTRLLEISDTTVRLVHAARQRLVEPYATLSHCWGEAPPSLLLTSTTFDKLQAGVQFDDFNSTFRDSFRVIRSLKLKYLWIDCYCIFQGGDQTSVGDWQRESQRMNKIYANAILNIGATHGIDTRAGLFSTRTRTTPLQHFVRWRPRPDSDKKLFEIRKHVRGESHKVDQHPLFSRAWIVQERLLASRMLHFGEGHLFWECAELRRVPEWRPHGSFNSRELLTGPGDLSYNAPGQTKSSLSGIWPDIFNQYGRGSLTHPDKDKVVALEGVGRRVAELSNDEYCNGFLQKDLPHSLCWYTSFFAEPDLGADSEVTEEARLIHNFSRRFRMPEQLRTPSWHWSSLDGELWSGIMVLNKSSRFQPLAWLFPSHGPFVERLRRDTTLLCLGRAVAVSCAKDTASPKLLQLVDSTNTRHILWSVKLEIDDTNLTTFLEDTKFSVFILPVTAFTTLTGDGGGSKQQYKQRLFANLLARRDPVYIPDEDELFPSQLGITGLVLFEIRKGIFMRVGTYGEMHAHETRALVNAMNRTPARLISIR